LPQVKVDEVLCFVCHIRSWTRRESKPSAPSRPPAPPLTKVTSNDAVPSGVVLLVELLLDECSNVLLNVILLQSLEKGGERRSEGRHSSGS
jgi:hypothetical protein